MRTRLNPTTNGDMHCGHACMAWVNWWYAYHEGEIFGAPTGRASFILRCEDNQTAWLAKKSQKEMKEIGMRWADDLAWLGIPPDSVLFESDFEDWISQQVHELRPLWNDTGFMPPPQIVGKSSVYYPYAPYLIAKVVLHDWLASVEAVITGEDLSTRFSGYAMLRDLLGIPQIPQLFGPRLMERKGQELANVSKTNGSFTIRQLRDKMGPQDVEWLLRRSYLKDPNGGWVLGNVKDQPVLEEIK